MLSVLMGIPTIALALHVMRQASESRGEDDRLLVWSARIFNWLAIAEMMVLALFWFLSK